MVIILFLRYQCRQLCNIMNRQKLYTGCPWFQTKMIFSTTSFESITFPFEPKYLCQSKVSKIKVQCVVCKKHWKNLRLNMKCIQLGCRSVVCLLIVLLTFAPEDFATYKQRGILATANKHVTDQPLLCCVLENKMHNKCQTKLRHFSWKYSPFLHKNQFQGLSMIKFGLTINNNTPPSYPQSKA